MDNQIKTLRAKVQVKLCQYIKKLGYGLTRPEQKFLADMMCGLLKGESVYLNGIGRGLQEKISLKKVTERLNRHLRKSGLGAKIMLNYLQAQSHKLRECAYFSLDVSDLSKRYAQKMEGLGWVWDGSAGEKSLGYWQVNVVGVSKYKSVVVPAYSETYSLEKEGGSENQRLMQAIDLVESVCPGKIWILDRGGDRGILFRHFLKGGKQPRLFIIRMQNLRDLISEEGKQEAIKWVAKYTQLPFHFQVKVKGKWVAVMGGARKVQLPGLKYDLYLVVLKFQGDDGGRFYFLTNIPAEDQQQLVEAVLRGYAHRWVIEEVHRELKQDFNWEYLRVHKYQAIKNLCALVWLAAGFYYTRLGPTLENPLILQSLSGISYRKKVREFLGFVYYKLKLMVAKLLEPMKLKKRIFFPQPTSQLCLKLIC